MRKNPGDIEIGDVFTCGKLTRLGPPFNKKEFVVSEFLRCTSAHFDLCSGCKGYIVLKDVGHDKEGRCLYGYFSDMIFEERKLEKLDKIFTDILEKL